MICYDFKGRVALITGAAGGIGRAIADRLAACGARLVLWDMRPLEGLPPDAIAEVVDVTDLAAVEAGRDRALAAAGRIDVLVNNAGIAGPTVPVEAYSPADWRRVMAINLDGVFHCCRAVAPVMRQQGWGRIVNIASLAGKEGTPNAAAYSASKAGVMALTKALGKELAGTGVLCNAIAPAAVETALLEQMTEEHVRIMVAKSPMGRLGRPEEVAALAAWLASNECSFSTGAVFDLSGGRATY
jgi:NAD(P)-dependent dehydrogenase (short-subunit alcohol dehydrogenase family)